MNQEIKNGKPPAPTSSTFKVIGMDCADEVAAVKSVFDIPLVYSVQADLIKETVTISHSDELKSSRIISLIEKAGLKVAKESTRSFYQDHSKRISIVMVAGILLSIGLILEWAGKTSPILSIIIFLASIFLSGILVFPKAFRSLKDLRFDMNVLMTIAVIGAICIKEYSEAASVVFLFSLAELLEALSVSRARKAIQEVLKIAPKNAILIKADGSTSQKSVEELSIGDIILVRPHDNIATDGTIIEGESSINQASLTGESKAVDKKVGDKVFGGTINESSVIKVKVEKEFQDSKLAKVIHLIESAQNEKAPSQRFVDKFASIYTPTVLVLAIFVALAPPLLGYGTFEVWIYKALVFLVIGCPCALVIATPISVVSGLTSLAKKGILVKGGVHLETLAKLKALAVDKTGTITEGKPSVSSLKTFSKISEEDCIYISASLESLSSHPLALAIVDYANGKYIKQTSPQDYKVLIGKGAEGVVNGHLYFVGNHKLAHEKGVCTPEIEEYLNKIESESMSVIILGHQSHDSCKGEVLAIFSLSDQIRTNIQSTVKSLHDVGISQVVMLSGDNQKTVDTISRKAGIDIAKGGLMPEDKVTEIKKLVNTHKFVGMVGDGINDAPALASASLGIAMGLVGSDTALETADMTLMKDDLAMIPLAIRQGKRALNIIQFNISFAIAIKAIFFVLAFLGMANLWVAVAADMGASLLVTFNALRLLRSE